MKENTFLDKFMIYYLREIIPWEYDQINLLVSYFFCTLYIALMSTVDKAASYYSAIGAKSAVEK